MASDPRDQRIASLEAAVLELLDRVRDLERAEQERVKHETPARVLRLVTKNG